MKKDARGRSVRARNPSSKCMHCNLDQVKLTEILDCVCRSFQGIYNDLFIEKKSNYVEVLLQDDRILYMLGIVIALLAIRILLRI